MSCRTRAAVTRIVVVLGATLLAAAGGFAQSGAEWAARGDRAAAADRHDEAIAAYRAAIDADPGSRIDLLPRLARQLLWSDRPSHAASLFREFLESHPENCEIRNDYGLALAWSDRLDAAEEAYRRVIDRCPEQRTTARLRLALVQRWQDRPSSAAETYRSVLAERDDDAARAASIGLGYVALLEDRNRAALEMFRELSGPEATDAAEGEALALTRLGQYELAAGRVRWVESHSDSLSRDLRELDRHLASRDHPQAEADFLAFEDADETRFVSGNLGASFGWMRGRAGISLGRSELANDEVSIPASSVSLQAEHRWNPTWAAQASVRATDYEGLDWRPVSGEVGLVLTPSDEWRVDAAVARILVPDNLAATLAELSGNFISLGADYRVDPQLTIVGAADWTDWSAGNRRLRLRASPRWKFEGRPRITLEWPTLVQFYDEPFPFALFSPEEYIETGPGVNFYLRFRRVWNGSAYLRAGAQKESGGSWDPLGTAQVALWRDLTHEWSLRATAGWSNSNLASAGGFERMSIALQFVRRF